LNDLASKETEEWMRKSLWMVLALVVVVSASVARADTVTLDVSGTLTAVSGFGTCSPTCQLGGTIVFNNVTGALISEDVTLTGGSPPAGPFTKFPVILNAVAFTELSLLDATNNFLSLDFSTPTEGSLVGYAGSALRTSTAIFEGTPGGGGGLSQFFSLSSGSLTPAVTTPEPSSLALIAIGLGALLLMRKRVGHVRSSAI
jgi:PEP-CTERM motif